MLCEHMSPNVSPVSEFPFADVAFKQLCFFMRRLMGFEQVCQGEFFPAFIASTNTAEKISGNFLAEQNLLKVCNYRSLEYIWI